jgi:hypothetical protein
MSNHMSGASARWEAQKKKGTMKKAPQPRICRCQKESDGNSEGDSDFRDGVLGIMWYVEVVVKLAII